MGRKAKFLVQEKIRTVEDYLFGKKSASQICYELDVNKRTFYDWLRKYQTQGSQGLETLSCNKYYSETIKFQAITDYTKGLGSLNTICSKYNISSRSLLRQWIKKYNGHEELKFHNAQGEKSMTKGKKTTYEERIEIVAFCIANNNSYQLTTEKFQVSYQQVYTWVKKYRARGYEALSDNRGKRKAVEELTETEKIAAQLKLLEAENRHLKMENGFLKKLDQVERRRVGKTSILLFENTTKKPDSQ